ncbi:hypothetical protein M6B38_364115 [Iris pallida]|uniref:Uncharacterized protein n=1 Tax=Iris pallida TaxID=29817 RepID=A0AAX6GHN1_IRIPA|nr:hypothetical protein M6B38_364115 [Iris pallida]
MATSSSSAARVSLRLAVAILLLFAAFYVCRPLYWKLSATIHDIRHNKQTVKQGLLHLPLSSSSSGSLLFYLSLRDLELRARGPEVGGLDPRRVRLWIDRRTEHRREGHQPPDSPAQLIRKSVTKINKPNTRKGHLVLLSLKNNC